MSRPSDVPALMFADCVTSALMATSEYELYRCVRAWLHTPGPLMVDIAHLVPPRTFDALGRPQSFSKLIAAVRRHNNKTGAT